MDTNVPRAPAVRGTSDWRKFKLLTLFIVTAVTALAMVPIGNLRRSSVSPRESHSAISRLAKFKCLDLQDLSSGEFHEVIAIIDELTPIDQYDERLYAPRHVWKIDSPVSGLLLVQHMYAVLHNRSDRVRVYQFDDEGEVVDCIEFAVKARRYVRHMSYEESKYGFPCLMLESCNRINGQSLRRDYYGLTDHGVELLRVETGSGKIVPLARTRGIGPALVPPDRDDWSTWLTSRHRVCILRALVSVPRQAESVIKDDSVRNRLASLSRLPDPWLRSAASTYLAELQKYNESRVRDE